MSVENAQLELLKDRMSEGVVTFKFVKTDGSERIAKGTRCEGLIPMYNEKQVDMLANVAIMVAATLKTLDPLDMAGNTNLIELAPELEKALKPFMKREATERPHNSEIVNYYDIEAKGWRSFKVESFVEIL